MYFDRIVELTFNTEDEFSFGSGYLISQRHLLTARHVLSANATLGDPCVVRQLMSSHAAQSGNMNALRPDKVSGKVWWLPDSSVELDLAVIELDCDINLSSPSPSFGHMPIDGSNTQPFQCIGFPEAAGNDSRRIEGSLSYVPTSKQLDLDVTSARPENWRDWAGLSGAVVFSGSRALAVVRTVRPDWKGLLSATPLQLLLQNPSFQRRWLSAGLTPIEQQPLGAHRVSPPYVRRLREIRQHYLGRDNTSSPMFIGRKAELQVLDKWLEDDRASTSLIMVGAAGLGKTSLLLNWLGNPEAEKYAHPVAFLPISTRFGTNSPDIFWSMAAARLAQLAGLEFETPVTRIAEAYLSICLDSLDRLEDMGRRLLLVIDGLDEIADWQIDQRIFLNSRPGVRILVTARASGAAAVDRWLQQVGWRRGRQTTLLELQPLTRLSVSTAVIALSQQHPSLAADATALGEEIWRLSEGDPLQLGYYLDDILQAADDPHAEVATILATAHAGFNNYFASWVNAQKPYWLAGNQEDDNGEDDYRAILLKGLLALLACARGPIITPEIEYLLARTVNLKTPLSRARLQALNRFVIETSEGWTLAHPRLQSLLLDEFLEGGRILSARQSFIDWIREACESPEIARSNYLSRYGALHLTSSNASSQDMMLLASEAWARLSLIADESGRQLSMDLQLADREISARAMPGDPVLAWQWAIHLMQTSIVSRARLSAELLVAFVHHGLVRYDSAIRRLDLMPPRDKAFGLALLATKVSAAEREDLLKASLSSIPAITDSKQRTLALIEVVRIGRDSAQGCAAETALLQELKNAGSLYHWLQTVEQMAPFVSVETQQTLLNWTFSQIDSPESWRHLDVLLPYLRTELLEEAVALATTVSQRLGLTQTSWNAANADRLSIIDEAALPYLFPALRSDEKNRCWQRVYELTLARKHPCDQVDGMTTLWPWLHAAGRDDDVAQHLKEQNRWENAHAMATAFTRFARNVSSEKLSRLALELALKNVILLSQEGSNYYYFDLLVDLLDETEIEQCYQLALRAPSAKRQQALAQLASRLSRAQLQHIQNLEWKIGDRIEVASARLELQLQDNTELNSDQTKEALEWLCAACPTPADLAESIHHLLPVMTQDQRSQIESRLPQPTEDALLIAQPEDADPASLWTAIQRQKYLGTRVYALLKNYQRLRAVVPMEEMIQAVNLLIGDNHFTDALAGICLLPESVAAPLRAQLESYVANSNPRQSRVFKEICKLAIQDSDNPLWHKLALAGRDTIEDPRDLVPFLSLCNPSERTAYIEAIRRSWIADPSFSVDTLIKLLPLLEPHETSAFVAPWLAAIRHTCRATPDWLSELYPVPQPFATETMNAMQELMQGAKRTSILKFITVWAAPIAQTQGSKGLHALISGIRAAGQVFE